ncbi:MAG: histidinol-phosphate transaminase [Gammaproteobacteria bacterium]
MNDSKILTPLQQRVTRWIRPAIQELRAYAVPASGERIKLDAMENPYTWPEILVEAWLGEMRQLSLNRYPDPAARQLKMQLRQALGIPAAADLMLGNGSDELIQMIALAVAEPGRVVLAPEPTFVMYRMVAQVLGLRYVGVPLAPDFALDRAAMEAAIERHQPAVVFLSYPNNPTGNLFDPAVIEAVIRCSPGLVVVDEAYAAFTAPGEDGAEASCLDWLGRFENLLVLRTVSKMGLAGLRLGILAGPKPWLQEIDKTRLPYNISVLTQASAIFALGHWSVLQAQTAQVRRDREALCRELAAVAGVTVHPSRANFLLFRVPAGRADGVHAALDRAGVLIKNLHSAGGVLTDCLRVTVGTPEENQAFLRALPKALQEAAVAP